MGQFSCIRRPAPERLLARASRDFAWWQIRAFSCAFVQNLAPLLQLAQWHPCRYGDGGSFGILCSASQ
ncbi:hypothetical protein DO73_4494 [Burkholderia pseudomallei]|nr:hypothetical protein DO73_4494 [Burkholderia pseudomallei]